MVLWLESLVYCFSILDGERGNRILHYSEDDYGERGTEETGHRVRRNEALPYSFLHDSFRRLHDGASGPVDRSTHADYLYLWNQRERQ